MTHTRSTSRRILRGSARVLPACAALLLAFALLGCGHAAKSSSGGDTHAADALPTPAGGVVARVGSYAIGAQAFKDAYTEAVAAEPAATRAAALPPSFSSCVARLASIAKALNLTMPSKAQRAAKCRARYEATRDEVLSRAILGLWVAAEAKELGLQVSLGSPDELIGPRLQVESKRLAKLMTHSALAQLGALSRAQLRAYYESHHQLFAVPAQRDVRIVRVAGEDAANRVKHEIAAGKTFASAARGLPRQPQMAVHAFAPRYEWGDFREPVLNKAIFTAKPHVLAGPVFVSALYGYFIFEVLHEYPSYQKPFAQVESKVLAELPAKLRQERLTSFAENWTAKWRAQTRCSPGYIVELCGGAHSTPGGPTSQAADVLG